MKERLLKDWHFRRILYLAGGIAITIQAIADKQWILIIGGLYFTAMGLFAFGCAGGSCYVGTADKSAAITKNSDYEEVK